ncbi:SixA phosphatase family protein [Streptomonospora litoralis]|uniref:Phosphohistidine phosphatase SixA n=1 Tax=Streptomonospora litoralis TaxID=2498135 RepID=A0A4P6PV96_9ACTN|nr:histidine phosphatase family protein [Streptomonospora litoralis]QBI51993.1 Phosphohistidine phosphatase SixA [Streptomonospora litoralis]
MTKRLIVLRHAQAEPLVDGSDHERPLSEEGREQARAAGEYLAAGALFPDHVICSTALRTRQTLELVTEALPHAPSADYERDAYAADVPAILELVSRTDPEVENLLVVGHNPTMAQLVAAFMADEPLISFPTAGLAVVDLEVEWLYAAPGTGAARLLT